MLIQFVIMSSRPSVVYFSEDSGQESIHLDLNSGSIQHDDGIYRVEVEVRGDVPIALTDKLSQFRGFQLQVNSNYCFNPEDPLVTVDITLELPYLELIQVQPELVIASASSMLCRGICAVR